MFTESEKNALLAGLNSLVEHAPDKRHLQVAADLLPLAFKVQEMVKKNEEPTPVKDPQAETMAAALGNH